MPQELQITPVLNGFIVRAGCQTLVYDSTDKIITDFSDWVCDPQKIEKRYMELMEKKGICPPPPPPMTAQEFVNAWIQRTVSAPASVDAELRRDLRR